MLKVKGLSHIGLHAKDYPKMRDFYTRILGMYVNHEYITPPRVFLSARPTTDDHEILLVGERTAPRDVALLQQISFRLSSISEVLSFYSLFKREHVPIDTTMTHGYTVSIYFRDPDGNRVEVFYEDSALPHRFNAPLNLDQDEDGVRTQWNALIAEQVAAKTNVQW